MKNKRGQLSIFLLVGIILILLLLVILWVSSDTSSLKTFLKQTEHPVPLYVEGCVKFQIVDALEILSAQGGFIYTYDPNLTTTNRTFAYSIYDNQNTSPDIEFMENEISKYIENNIEYCVRNSTLPLTIVDQPTVETTIFPESVYVTMHYPLQIVTDDIIYTFDDFTSRHVVPFGRMIELRDTIVGDLIEYPNLMLLDKLYNTDFEMIVSPYSGKIKVIDMINTSARLRNNPLHFSFAIHDRHSLPPTLTFDRSIPDLTVNVGMPLILQASCNHRCKYYDNTILFDIDEDSGVIMYTPDILDVGTYNVTITIDDDTYKVSKKFKLVVEE